MLFVFCLYTFLDCYLYGLSIVLLACSIAIICAPIVPKVVIAFLFLTSFSLKEMELIN